jgi:hypothetical protein
MAMQGTANPETKVRRAKVHLDALEQEIAVFGNSKPYRIESHDDTQTSQYVVEVELVAPDIWPIGAILGDFVNCLRSSLDHLIYGLAHMHGVPSKKPSFPIIGIFNPDQTLATISECTPGVPDEAVAIIKSLQPYNAGVAYESTHLYRLNKLWNVDKHRHIPLHAGGSELRFPNAPRPVSTGIENDRLVMRFPLTSKSKVNLHPCLVIPILYFGKESEGVIIEYSDLVEMHKFVGEKIIPRFSRFYK